MLRRGQGIARGRCLGGRVPCGLLGLVGLAADVTPGADKRDQGRQCALQGVEHTHIVALTDEMLPGRTVRRRPPDLTAEA